MVAVSFHGASCLPQILVNRTGSVLEDLCECNSFVPFFSPPARRGSLEFHKGATHPPPPSPPPPLPAPDAVGHAWTRTHVR